MGCVLSVAAGNRLRRRLHSGLSAQRDSAPGGGADPRSAVGPPPGARISTVRRPRVPEFQRGGECLCQACPSRWAAAVTLQDVGSGLSLTPVRSVTPEGSRVHGMQQADPDGAPTAPGDSGPLAAAAAEGAGMPGNLTGVEGQWAVRQFIRNGWRAFTAHNGRAWH